MFRPTECENMKTRATPASSGIEILDFGEADQHRLMLSNEQTEVLRWAVAISRLTVADTA